MCHRAAFVTGTNTEAVLVACRVFICLSLFICLISVNVIQSRNLIFGPRDVTISDFHYMIVRDKQSHPSESERKNLSLSLFTLCFVSFLANKFTLKHSCGGGETNILFFFKVQLLSNTQLLVKSQADELITKSCNIFTGSFRHDLMCNINTNINISSYNIIIISWLP